MADQLLTALKSSKVVFWAENNHLPECEIQRLWDLRLAYLTSELGANLTGFGPSLPQKRSVPNTDSSGAPRPSKRRDFVGFSLQLSEILV
jgi:hypothetical protein